MVIGYIIITGIITIAMLHMFKWANVKEEEYSDEPPDDDCKPSMCEIIFSAITGIVWPLVALIFLIAVVVAAVELIIKQMHI